MHLAAGLTAGVIIGILCLTGFALAFEKPLVAWAERDARRIPATSAGTARLPLSELSRRAQAENPGARLTAITVLADPQAAVVFSFGRDDLLFGHPHTGEIRRPRSTALRAFMQRMVEWHRYLALDGDQRPYGKAVIGAANLLFCFLAVSGLYLWWPRSWQWAKLQHVAWPRLTLAGKARDFNWHNAIGIWCAPVLIVLTLTAIPISYRWGTDLIYRALGETPPATPGPGASVPPARSTPGSALALDALFATVRQAHPDWQNITLRLAPTRGAEAPTTAAVFAVRHERAWPRTATTTVHVDPGTGTIAKSEGHSDLGAARRLRTWTRFLHTGEAIGGFGQAVAALGSLGGCLLVYTGVALSVRRFRARRSPGSTHPD